MQSRLCFLDGLLELFECGGVASEPKTVITKLRLILILHLAFHCVQSVQSLYLFSTCNTVQEQMMVKSQILASERSELIFQARNVPMSVLLLTVLHLYVQLYCVNTYLIPDITSLPVCTTCSPVHGGTSVP